MEMSIHCMNWRVTNILDSFSNGDIDMHSHKLGWIGCAIQQATSKWLPGFFFRFDILIFIYFFKYKTIETHARAFLPLNISAVGSVYLFIEFAIDFKMK